MIHLIVACSWCDTKTDMRPSFSDTVVVSDDFTVIWREGEPYVFCCDGCRDAALELLGQQE